MVVVAAYRLETRYIQQQCTVRECFVENMDESEIQAKDCFSRDSQLVSLLLTQLQFTSLTSHRLKDCDVTWLYGPLQTGAGKSFMPTESTQGSRISKSNSFIDKKPILKKRSMSELMLQRSLSASSLVRQAAAAVQAQQSGSTLRPCINRATSDYVTFPFLDRRTSAENSSVLQSISSSGITSPSYEKKHIHFNEQVEQCIALEIKGDDDEEIIDYGHDSDSDSDDVVMMKRSNSKRLLPPIGGRRKPSRNNSSTNTNETKTIAVLPSTTLKYKDDEPEQETAQKHSGFWKLSPSPSQETLRPSKPSKSSFILNDDSDDEMDLDWQPPAHSAFANRKDSISVAQDRMNGLQISGSSSSEAGPSGMRRTPSGMFMPVDPEDEEDAAVSEGLFGKVVDAVNTAKDIGHVIWNVGWRR